MRRVAAGLLVVAAFLMTAATPTSADSNQTAADVADEIIATQAAADAAAVEWTDLEDQATSLGQQLAAGEVQVAEAQARVEVVDAERAAIALNRYTGATPHPAVPFAQDPMLQVEEDELSAFASDTATDDADRYEAAHTDLVQDQLWLASLRDQNANALDALEAKRSTIAEQLKRLQQLETKLRDAAVKKAYAEKLATQRAAAADAAAKAAQEKAAKETAASVVAKASAAVPRGGGQAATLTPTPAATSGPPATATAATTPSAPSPAKPQAPATVAAPAPPTPLPPAPAAPTTVGGLVCPVAGPNAFGDTWGAPRAGGKRHEGVDMMSPLGTPIVAVTSGFATMKTNRLGGNAIGLKADNGDYFYYAHLNDWAGPSRHVAAGEVVGFVGHTGETSADHLHVEIHPGGGPAINPYPTTRSIC